MPKMIVAVFGGTGYTGRFVVRELLRREIRPVAIARHPAAFAASGFADSTVECRQSTIDDAMSLDRELNGTQAVINCAGPFVDTADAIVSAALRAGIHYVDVAAEQVSVANTLGKFDKPASKAGVAVVPSMVYFGGLSDLMATALLGDWDSVDSIEVLNGFDSWHPTLGTRNTIARKSVGNLMITRGRLAEVSSPPAQKRWTFAGPVGDQAVIELPLAETVLIARHVQTTELHTYLTQVAVGEVLNPATPPPQAADAMGRSAQKFVVEVVATRGNEFRRAIVRGRDSYAVTAPLACEAAERLLKGQFSAAGAHAPGEIFDAKAILRALAPDYPVDLLAV